MAATELATAYVSLVPSLRGASGHIAKELGNVDADGIGRSVGSRMGGGLLGTFKGLVGPALAVIGSGMFAGFIAEAAVASDATDKFKSTMNFAGLDTSAIDAATKAAKAYADQTVYDLPTIQATMAQLAANGVKDYTAITTAAGNLNAVAGGNAETFQSVARSITQSAGAGKLMTEDWNMLADAIPGASGKLKESMLAAGAYTGDFKKAMEKGEITAAEFQTAITELGSQPVAQEAARSVTTFEGAIGNLEATINSGLMGALDAMKPQLTGMISAVSTGVGAAFDFLGNAIPGLVSLFRDGDFTGALSEAFGVEEDSPLVGGLFTIRETVQSVFGGIRDFIAGFTLPMDWADAAPLTGMVAAGAGVRDFFAGIRDAVTPLVGPMLDLFASVSPLSTVFQAIQPFLPPLLAVFGQMAGIVGGTLLDAISGILPSLQILQGVAVDLFQGVLATVLPIVVQLVTMLGATFAELMPVLVPIITQVATLAAALVSQLAPIFLQLVSTVMPMVVTVLGAVLAAIVPLISTVAGLLIPIISALMPVVVTVFSVIANVVTSVMQIIMGVIQVVTGIISGNWAQVWSGILNVVGGVFGLILDVIGGAIRLVMSVVLNGLNAVLGFFIGILGGVVSYAVTSWGSIVNGAGQMIGDLIGFFAGIGGKILGALGDVGSTLYNAGRNIVQGLIDGIGSMLGAIGRAVLNIVPEAIRGPFEDLMGIHSPSTVARWWGQHIGGGLVLGVEDSYDPVAEAMALLVQPPELPTFASTGARTAYAEAANPGDTDGRGAGVHIDVHPSEKMSEENLANITARKIVGAVP